ncbi:MAG TPA: hypothetical protein VFL73_00265 [Solirubrobacteraceae bacterium]|nr:hypothetical protein [Solirubrobacteraceae bacterium]
MSAGPLLCRVSLRTAIAVAVVALFALHHAAAATAAGTPVQVVFEGNGTYTIDQSYQASGGSCSTHDVGALTWSVSFQATIDNGVLQGATGELASGVGPGTLDFSVSGICTYNNTVPPCSTSLSPSASSPPPALSVSGNDPQHVEAQSIAGTLTTSGCSSTDGPFVGRDLYFLNQSLPGSLTAVANIPRAALNSRYTSNVSSADAPGQVTQDCTGQGPAASSNTACTASLTWSGTLTVDVVPDCGKRENQALPFCIGKAKADARRTAAFWHSTIKPPCSSGTLRGNGVGACIANSTYNAAASEQWLQYLKIANDPPDPGYQTVARPRSPSVKGLALLRRFSPATYRLLRRYLKIGGLVGAVITAQERAAGALVAVRAGDSTAAAALARQDAAELSYDKQAVKLLRGQDRLARKAAAQLRQHVGTLPRTLAARLTSKAAVRANRLGAAVLNAIGR